MKKIIRDKKKTHPQHSLTPGPSPRGVKSSLTPNTASPPTPLQGERGVITAKGVRAATVGRPYTVTMRSPRLGLCVDTLIFV